MRLTLGSRFRIICAAFYFVLLTLNIRSDDVFAENIENDTLEVERFTSQKLFIASKPVQARILASNFRCPAGKAPIYSVILVHGAGNGMLCALARSDAKREFEERKQRAQSECTSGATGNIFLEASLLESSSCECKPYTPDCTTSLSQEFFCCGQTSDR